MPKSFADGPRDGNEADAIAEQTQGVLERLCYLLGYNGSTFDRLRSGANNADAQAVATLGILKNLSHLMGYNGSTFDRLRSGANNADGVAAETLGLLKAQASNYLWNETGWDRARPNTKLSVLASAERTASADSGDLTNQNARGLHLQVNVTSITATPSVVVKIQGKDEESGAYYDLLETDAITDVTGTGIYIFKVYPGLTPIANAVANDILPRTFKVTTTHGDTDGMTYSIGASLVL